MHVLHSFTHLTPDQNARSLLVLSVLELGVLLSASRSLQPQDHTDFNYLLGPLAPLAAIPDNQNNSSGMGVSQDDQAARCSNTYTNFLTQRDANDNDDLYLDERCQNILSVLDYIEDLENDPSCSWSSVLRQNQQDAVNHRPAQCCFFKENWCWYFNMENHSTCTPFISDCA